MSLELSNVTQSAYLVAALLFILALAALSRHETAKIGNTIGVTGMVVAMAATVAVFVDDGVGWNDTGLLSLAVLSGASVGLWRARAVEMTGMPELIALLHSFVGLAAVLVGWNGFLHVENDRQATPPRPSRAKTSSASTPLNRSSASSSAPSPSRAQSSPSSNCPPASNLMPSCSQARTRSTSPR